MALAVSSQVAVTQSQGQGGMCAAACTVDAPKRSHGQIGECVDDVTLLQVKLALQGNHPVKYLPRNVSQARGSEGEATDVTGGENIPTSNRQLLSSKFADGSRPVGVGADIIGVGTDIISPPRTQKVAQTSKKSSKLSQNLFFHNQSAKQPGPNATAPTAPTTPEAPE